MFIPPLRNNYGKLPKYEPFIADESFDEEKDLVEFIKKQNKIEFKRPGFLGFTEVDDIGYSCNKKIKIHNKEYYENAIFVLNKKGNKIRETFNHTLVQIKSQQPSLESENMFTQSKDNVLEKINKMRSDLNASQEKANKKKLNNF